MENWRVSCPVCHDALTTRALRGGGVSGAGRARDPRSGPWPRAQGLCRSASGPSQRGAGPTSHDERRRETTVEGLARASDRCGGANPQRSTQAAGGRHPHQRRYRERRHGMGPVSFKRAIVPTLGGFFRRCSGSDDQISYKPHSFVVMPNNRSLRTGEGRLATDPLTERRLGSGQSETYGGLTAGVNYPLWDTNGGKGTQK